MPFLAHNLFKIIIFSRYLDFDMQNFHIVVENEVRQKWCFVLNKTKIDHYLDNFGFFGLSKRLILNISTSVYSKITK